MALLIEASIPRADRDEVTARVKKYLAEHGFREDGDRFVYGGSDFSGSGATLPIKRDVIEAVVGKRRGGIEVRFTRSSGTFYNGELVQGGGPPECSEAIEGLPRGVFDGYHWLMIPV